MMSFPCPGWQQGSDSIESTYRKQTNSGGVRQDTVLVIDEERPFIPDRDVLRKTEILGTGVRSPSRKKPGKADGDDGD